MSHDLPLVLLASAGVLWIWARASFSSSWLSHPTIECLVTGGFVSSAGLVGVTCADPSTIDGLFGLLAGLAFILFGAYIFRVTVLGYLYSLQRSH